MNWNDDTSPETLTKLAMYFIASVCHNAASNPNALSSALDDPAADEVDAYLAAARHSGSGLHALYHLLRGGKIVPLAAFQNLPPSLSGLPVFTQAVSAELGWIARRKPRLPLNPRDDALLREALWTLAWGNDSSLRLFAVEHEATPPDALAPLAKDVDVKIRLAVARHPACPGEALAILAKDGGMKIRTAVAQNPACPGKILALLAKNGDVEIRLAVAQNPACPGEALALLAKDEDMEIRTAVARNPACPRETLALLAKDKDSKENDKDDIHFAGMYEALVLLGKPKSRVRRAVAGNTATPSDILALLAEDENFLVREKVAVNTATSRDILAVLAEDVEANVRQRALETLRRTR
jgi:hypothetical protein